MSEREIKQGDVFRWRYRDSGDDRAYGRYHCCSCIAVADAKGGLQDTYWFDRSGRYFDADDQKSLELTFLANMNDLQKIEHYDTDYYDDADIVDLTHANSFGPKVYIRKGAKRSLSKMIAVAKDRLQHHVSTARQATFDADRYRGYIAKLEAGDTTDVYL